MVSKSYLLDKPAGPSTLKRRFDQVLIPAALNAVAPVEGALYRLSDRARARPAAALLMALATGYALSRWAFGRRASWRR